MKPITLIGNHHGNHSRFSKERLGEPQKKRRWNPSTECVYSTSHNSTYEFLLGHFKRSQERIHREGKAGDDILIDGIEGVFGSE